MTAPMKKDFQLSDPNWNKGEADQFKNLALRYTEIGANEGIRIIPFFSPEMPFFQKASSEERKSAIDFLSTLISIHEETLAGGDKVTNSKKLIWRALVKLTLTPTSDIFDYFTEEDVIIIYQPNHKALFWNLQFFNFTSITVEQLFFTNWFDFTKRDPHIQQHLYEMALKVNAGEITGTFVPGVPGHMVEEIDSLECLKTWMELPHGSVLTRNGALGGVLMVQRMKLLG